MAKNYIFESSRPKRTQKQIEASKSNIKQWNDLVKRIYDTKPNKKVTETKENKAWARDKAKQLKDKYGSTKAVWERLQGNFHISKETHDQVKGGARKGTEAHERYTRIVDLVFDGDGDIARGYDSEDLFEAIDEYDPEVENEDLFEQHRHRIDEEFSETLKNGPPL